MLRKACSEAATWPSNIRVAVNVSAAQFKNAAVVRAVMDALAASGLPAHRLELEITESVLLNDSVTTLATLHTLKRLGVRVAMDDFGTGFSSLSYLQSFPFDKIKIDQSFVRNLAAPGNSRLIVRSVVGLGRSLGITTTAEGIETEAQLEQLRLEGCDEGQGYLFSRPVPSATIRELVTALGRNAA
ncbi:EAL domain-containing protein (putative c-di-GMP-specific phosphodiesterase class I) [Methylorubrum pseudosasae]|nr:EAL domain-containing protein (putative c-di-GMP-specific phosphodiesterase class I) [Methylorubrum pseudosasae]